MILQWEGRRTRCCTVFGHTRARRVRLIPELKREAWTKLNLSFSLFFDRSSQAGLKKLTFSLVCLFRLWLVYTHKTVLRCLSTCTLPFLKGWKSVRGVLTAVSQHPATCSNFSHQPLVSKCGFKARICSMMCPCTVCRPSVTCQVAWSHKHTFSASTYLQRRWTPTSYCGYLSSTFDGHLTDLTNIRCSCGQRSDVRITFHCKMFTQC